jgi:O-antigen ligase
VPAAVVLAALLVAELATLSRGGLLAIATVVFIAIITLRALWVRVVLLVGAVAGAAGVVRLPFLGLRVQQSLDPVSGSLFTRERVWVATIHMLRDHPVFGAGINAYQSVMAPYRASDPNQVPEPYPHNIVLTSWTELGVLGVLAFLWILGGLMIQPWRAFGRATGIDRALLWGTGAAFAMIAVHGLVDSPYWKNDLSLEFWLLAALQVVSLRTLARPSAS